MQSRIKWLTTHLKVIQEMEQERKTLKEIAYQLEKQFGIIRTPKQVSNAIINHSISERVDRRDRLDEEQINFLRSKYDKGLSPKIIVAAFNKRYPGRIRKMTYMSFAVMCSKKRKLFPRRNAVRIKDADTELRDDTK